MLKRLQRSLFFFKHDIEWLYFGTASSSTALDIIEGM